MPYKLEIERLRELPLEGDALSRAITNEIRRGLTPLFQVVRALTEAQPIILANDMAEVLSDSGAERFFSWTTDAPTWPPVDNRAAAIEELAGIPMPLDPDAHRRSMQARAAQRRIAESRSAQIRTPADYFIGSGESPPLRRPPPQAAPYPPEPAPAPRERAPRPQWSEVSRHSNSGDTEPEDL